MPSPTRSPTPTAPPPSTTLTITITGTNDAPVAVADTNGGDAVIESGVNPGNTPFAGDPSAAGNVLANDTDVDAGDTRTVTAIEGSASHVGQLLAGVYGTMTLGADGNWTYTLDNSDPDTEALAQGATGDRVFTYTITDASGATSSATLSGTVIGTNDAPIALADDSQHGALVVRGSGGQASGNVLDNDIDVDTGDTKTVTEVNGSAANVGQTLVGIYGTLILAADGAWTYTLDENDPDTMALGPNDTAIDAFTYTMSDGH